TAASGTVAPSCDSTEPWTALRVRRWPPRATGGESSVTTTSTIPPRAGADVPAPAAGSRRSASRERRATRCRLDMVERKTSAARISQPLETRGCGGIGRRARFRSVWGRPRGGSSPLIRTFCLLRARALDQPVAAHLSDQGREHGSHLGEVGACVQRPCIRKSAEAPAGASCLWPHPVEPDVPFDLEALSYERVLLE